MNLINGLEIILSKKFGPVRSVKPSLVVEIAFDNINFSSRHKSGVALRFPRFSRIRWDKPPNEVCILKRCEKPYKLT